MDISEKKYPRWVSWRDSTGFHSVSLLESWRLCPLGDWVWCLWNLWDLKKGGDRTESPAPPNSVPQQPPGPQSCFTVWEAQPWDFQIKFMQWGWTLKAPLKDWGCIRIGELPFFTIGLYCIVLGSCQGMYSTALLCHTMSSVVHSYSMLDIAWEYRSRKTKKPWK